MKCGICGKGTMRGWNDQEVPIYSRDALRQHKRAEHKTEYYAAIDARRTKAQAKATEAQRVSDARLAASRPVVVQSAGDTGPITYPSSRLRRFDVCGWNGSAQTVVRFPDPEAYRLYEEIMAEISKLEGHARVYLTTAWEMGWPVTLDALDELDRAALLGG